MAPFMVNISEKEDNYIPCTKLEATLGSISKSIFLTWEGSYLHCWTRGYSDNSN